VSDNIHKRPKKPDDIQAKPRHRNRDKSRSNQTTLKDLSRLMPNGRIIKSLESVEARSATLVLSSLVDAYLELAIRSCFVPLNETQVGIIFRYATAPLSSFSSKISIGHALGIFNKDFEKQLNKLRDIRNAFAHSIIPIDFTNETIAKECNKLDVGSLVAPQGFEFVDIDDTPKARFLAFGQHACVHLMKYLMSKIDLAKAGIPVLPSPFVYRYE
jgi:hypothetical protein